MGIQDRDYYRQHHDPIAAAHGGFRKHSLQPQKGRGRGVHWAWIALGWVAFLALCYVGARWYLAHYPLPARFHSLGRFLT